jgi:hypothetical protein
MMRASQPGKNSRGHKSKARKEVVTTARREKERTATQPAKIGGGHHNQEIMEEGTIRQERHERAPQPEKRASQSETRGRTHCR